MEKPIDEDIKDFLRKNAMISRTWGTTRQYFGLGTMVAGFFLLGLNLVFPAEDRVFWSTCCFIVLAIGAWQLDVAKKEIAKQAK